MHITATSMLTRRICVSILVAGLLSIAALMTSGASADAAVWHSPGKADARFHCSGYNAGLNPIVFQDCVIVTHTKAGTYSQSVLAVSNRGSSSAGLYGTTITSYNGGPYSGDSVRTDCGYTVIAPHGRKWCWGGTLGTRPSVHASVQGQGWVGFPGRVALSVKSQVAAI